MQRRHVRRDVTTLLAGCLTLAACHRDAAATNAITVVDGRQTGATATRSLPHPLPSASPSPRAVPTIAASPPGPNPQLARQPFRSPPLPPELANDSGLVPLPPRPPASAFGEGEQH